MGQYNGGEDTIVEVKCSITAYKTGIAEAIENKKNTFWKEDAKGVLKINKTHNWFYQVQGQIHVTQRSKCLFAVWANEKEPLKTEIILRDDIIFWKENMEAKLNAFYKDCILPEFLEVWWLVILEVWLSTIILRSLLTQEVCATNN